MDKAAIISRIQDELEKASFLQREASSNYDLCSRCVEGEAAAYQAGLVSGYKYCGGVLLQILLDIAHSDQSQDGKEG